MLMELDHRHNHGIDVTLLWDSEKDTLHVAVLEERGEDGTFFKHFDVRDRAEALAAFNHPFSYA